jgi:chlorobactene glucosyltransferase
MVRINRLISSTPGKALLWGYGLGVASFYAALFRRTGLAGANADVVTADASAIGTPEAEWPCVSIIIPARDEERNIRSCVASLLAQRYPSFEVIVVDDASSDATPRILAELQRIHPEGARLRIERVRELPSGWAGKPHALHVGTRVARGEWLLFTDADTRHAPGALSAAVQIARARKLDLLSFGTQQEAPDFWSRVLMPMAYLGISMMYAPAAVNDPDSPVAIANGQYILIRRAAYDRLGGYASPALRGTVVDDRDLAVAVKRSGGHLALVDGRRYVRTRMYSSLREHWDGWSKNAYVGSRGGPLFYLAMVAGLPLAAIGPFALLFHGLAHRDRTATATGALATGAVLAYRARLDGEMGVPRRYGLTHPLAGAVFTGILLRSLWRKLSGLGVVWRGRIIRV